MTPIQLFLLGVLAAAAAVVALAVQVRPEDLR
jgi:hypothetical protein